MITSAAQVRADEIKARRVTVPIAGDSEAGFTATCKADGCGWTYEIGPGTPKAAIVEQATWHRQSHKDVTT